MHFLILKNICFHVAYEAGFVIQLFIVVKIILLNCIGSLSYFYLLINIGFVLDIVRLFGGISPFLKALLFFIFNFFYVIFVILLFFVIFCYFCYFMLFLYIFCYFYLFLYIFFCYFFTFLGDFILFIIFLGLISLLFGIFYLK